MVLLQKIADKTVSRWRSAIFSIFLVNGLVIGALLSRMPAMREELSGTTATVGLLLFFLSIGSTSGLLLAPVLLKKLGARYSLTLLTVILAFSTALIGMFSSVFANIVAICAVLVVLGITLGASDVQINVEGALIEKRIGGSLLPFLHAGFSVGSVIGASIGTFTEGAHFNIFGHLSIVMGLGLLVALFIFPRIPARDYQRIAGREQAEPKNFSLKTFKNVNLLLIGIMLLGIALAEGGANDWVGIAMVDGHGETKSNGALLLTLLLMTITVVRLLGSWLINTFGSIRVIQGSMVVAVAGLSTFILGDGWFFYITGAVLWGIGVALGFPVCISLAAAGSSDSAARVTAVSIVGYLAFLGGPPTLGFIAEHIGILNTLWILVASCTAALIVSFWVVDRTKETFDTSTNPIVVAEPPAGLV